MVENEMNVMCEQNWGRVGNSWCGLLARLVCAAAVLLCARISESATLQQLLDGATLAAGNARFSNWELLYLNADATTPNTTLITVNPLSSLPAQPGVQFIGNNQLTTSGSNSLEMTLRFRVDAVAGTSSFVSHSLDMFGGVSFGGSGGIVNITQEISDNLDANLGATLVSADKFNNLFMLTNSAALEARSQVFVTLNVLVAGTTEPGTTTLSSFAHRLSQTGPVGHAGDYNQDGAVDAADYTMWRDNLGAPAGTLPNDTAGGVIGAGQYNLWKANFGAAGSGGMTVGAVPEPGVGAVLLAVWGTACVSCRRRN